MYFENEKTGFLYRELAKAAIDAALQHNPFYKKDAIRDAIREYWIELLFAMTNKYTSHQDPKEFVNDIRNIQSELNNKYSGKIICRLSHAQKSLAVFLKYLWCMGGIEEPPVCPIDRRVLWEAGIKDEKTGRAKKWTELNDLDEYKQWLKKIAEVAKGKDKSMAHWELEIWNTPS